MKANFWWITLGIASVATLGSLQAPCFAQKGRVPFPKPQPKVAPKQTPPFRETPSIRETPAKEFRLEESTSRKAADKARLLAQNTEEMKAREEAEGVLKKQATANNLADAKQRLEMHENVANAVAKLPAADKQRMEQLLQNQGAVRTKLQNASTQRLNGFRANPNVVKGYPEIQPVDPKQNQALTNQVATYHNTAKKLGIQLDPYGRPVNAGTRMGSLATNARDYVVTTNGASQASTQFGFGNAASMSAGGGAFGAFPGVGTPISALSIPPAIGQIPVGNSLPGYVSNLGGVLIPNSPGEMPAAVSAGVVPDFAGGYQVVQSLPSGTDTGSQSTPSDSFLTEGTDAGASIRQLTRFVRFTNSTDKKATFFIHYETVDTEGRRIWLPPKEDGVSYAASVEVGPGQSVDLKEGEWRVNASRARVWAVSGDREWLRYRNLDFWFVPEVDEDGNHSYRAPNPEILSYTIG